MDKQSIIDSIMNTKTKWWEYFKRFYENHTDLFWKFRELNHTPNVDVETWSEFQKFGREVESQMFYLENLLTAKQTWSKSSGLDKTVTAFYNLVESYFPLYGKIE